MGILYLAVHEILVTLYLNNIEQQSASFVNVTEFRLHRQRLRFEWMQVLQNSVLFDHKKPNSYCWQLTVDHLE